MFKKAPVEHVTCLADSDHLAEKKKHAIHSAIYTDHCMQCISGVDHRSPADIAIILSGESRR